MRLLFIIHIVCCLIFFPFQSFAIVSGSAVRSSTTLIKSISTAGATYGGASGSKIMTTFSRSFAAGYAASPSGVIASGAAGGYEAAGAVALSRGATGGLLRLAFQGAAAGSRMIPYVGAVITAASLAGMAWEWYQDEYGNKFFRQKITADWKPTISCGYLMSTGPSGIKDNGVDMVGYFYNNYCAAYESYPFGTVGNAAGYRYEYNSQMGTANVTCLPGSPCVVVWYPDVSIPPPEAFIYKKVPWDDVQKAIEDDLATRPQEWANPFADAVKEVPPAVNPWLDETSKEDAAKPAPVPMPDVLPYPTPSGTPSVPNPATGEPMPAPLPNELTKEDISKVASEILNSMNATQTNNVATGDVTKPTPNQDLASQISSALAAKIPQPPYDVKVINEPTIKIKTEDSWKSDAESAVGSETQPDSNDELDLNLDLEKYKSKKRDLSFLDTIYTNIKSLPLFQLFQKTPISITGGSSQLCLEVPYGGKKCVDLDNYSSAFDTLGSVSIALCFFACLAIIFL